MDMIKVYVAGAYSASNVLDVLKNIGRGEFFASRLFQHGFAPFTPWHDKDFVIKNWHEQFTVEQFYEYSIAWLKVSDCLFVVPDFDGLMSYKESKGTLKEIEIAEDMGIPIFYDLNELISYYDEHVNDDVFCINCDYEAHKDKFQYDSAKNCYYCPNCGAEILNF